MKLQGKLIIKGLIETNTGLHIGGSSTGIDIGGMDNSVIKDSKGRPYIPGSTIKGKMRSLLEILEGKYSGRLSEKNGKYRNKIMDIYDSNTLKDAIKKMNEDKKKKYELNVNNCNCGEIDCHICRTFGTSVSEANLSGPTRFFVRDAYLVNGEEMLGKKEGFEELEFDYTESKTENALDRFTSKANPRTIERVPAGAKFSFEFVYNIYDKKDIENFKYIRQAINLLEDDYIGGNGSRGYGQIKFETTKIKYKSAKSYINEENAISLSSLDEINEIKIGE